MALSKSILLRQRKALMNLQQEFCYLKRNLEGSLHCLTRGLLLQCVVPLSQLLTSYRRRWSLSVMPD